jgi:hypothetical protein
MGIKDHRVVTNGPIVTYVIEHIFEFSIYRAKNGTNVLLQLIFVQDSFRLVPHLMVNRHPHSPPCIDQAAASSPGVR